MIVDLRTYTLAPGKLADFLEKYETQGLPIQQKHLGLPIGYFFTEVGPLNQVVHLWGYQSMADREAKRGALEGDPVWWEYRNRMSPLGHLHYQENKILRSTKFSPI